MKHEKEEYEVPNKEKNVWPEDLCPAFTRREGSIDSLKACWYCRYADFHLNMECALEVGVCRWPKKVL